MDEVLLRRLVGAGVLFSAAFATASLLPERRVGEQPSVAEAARQTFVFDLTGSVSTGAGAGRAPEPADGSPPDAPASSARAEGSGWYIQVGSFGSQDNARKALVDLYRRNLPAQIESVQVGTDIWYRVRVGPYEDEAPARAVLDALPKDTFRGARLLRVDRDAERG